MQHQTTGLVPLRQGPVDEQFGQPFDPGVVKPVAPPQGAQSLLGNRSILGKHGEVVVTLPVRRIQCLNAYRQRRDQVTVWIAGENGRYGHSAFELYDFGYVDDIRILVQHDNLVAINNALMVDLTGQVASETIGPRVHTGVGGQTAFSIAANYSKGGRSITVLPSSHVIEGQRVSRIVPSLPEAAVVTVPRTLVDYVVTEHGIAALRGKSIRERVGELIAVAHPDFRAELKSEAKRLHNVSI